MKIYSYFALLLWISVGCNNTAPTETPPTDIIDIHIYDSSNTDMETFSEPDTGPDLLQNKSIIPHIEGWEQAEDINPDPDIVEINLRAEYKQVDIGGGQMIQMMTYNGIFPGPLIQAKVGDRLIIHFENKLTEPTTIHWHGLRISDQMDGSPRIQAPIGVNGTFEYDFIVPDAGTFWYHPHINANEQVEQGLYGGLIIHDPNDPVVDQERFIIVDDILLNGDTIAPFLANHHEFVHGRSGNTLLINGKATFPILSDIAGRTERWRIVNASNARTFVLSMEGTKPLKVIATDGGLLEGEYITPRIEVAVGQRYDLEVVNHPQKATTLQAHILTQNAQGEVEEIPFPLYRADVGALSADNADEFNWIKERNLETTPLREVEFILEGYTDETGQIVWTINGKAHSKEPLFTFNEGDVIEMKIVNKQGPYHPFHLHGQFFKILDDGDGNAPLGLRDTVLVPGLKTVKILAYMDNPGRWMAHCHILEHAKLGMMSEIIVLPNE